MDGILYQFGISMSLLANRDDCIENPRRRDRRERALTLNTKRRNRYRRRGFTLVEVISATVLLSGTIIGFITIMSENLSVSREAELRIHASLLAEGEVERIKAAFYDDFSTDVSGWSSDLGQDYRVSRSVTTVNSYLKEIEVEVGYDTDGDNSLDSEEVLVTLTTQYADT
ncbi:MAG: hypothetical protein MI922_00315 [Bacteroidales bacterium]|nr:hypothetical protein [Bacteroidales bacterium]